MRANDLLEHLQRRPFDPIILTLTDGRTYEIRHPELAMVGISSVIVGVPSKETRDPVYERAITISLQHIMQIEPVNGSSQPAEGTPPPSQ